MGNAATAGPAQHLRALEHANKIRLARAELKRRIAAGETTAADVVLQNPRHAENMAISELLMAQRRWGRTRCRRLLTSLGIAENKRLGTLTERQRRMLAAMLSSNAASEPPEDPPRPARADQAIGRVLTTV